ncbi:MAG: hypothetical protein ABIJ23_00040 [Candidatus Magasanikbacteria bacterium]
MTPRRKETNLTGGQSVRFYKIIALSFLFLTIVLLAVIIFMSSKRATITVVTKPEPVEIDSTLEIKDGEGGGMVTTTIVEISKVFAPRSVKEEISIATGVVTLHNERNYAQPLVATTRLLSSDGVLFRLKDRVTVAGNSTIEAEVYADEEGKGGEIGPTSFTIPGLSEEVQKYIYATSDEDMVGGVRTYGIVTEEDLKKASDELVMEMGKVGKKELAGLNTDLNGVFAVVSYDIKTDVEMDTEVEEFEVEGTATIVGVFYDEVGIVEQAKKDLEKRIVSDAEKLTTSDIEPTVTLGDYDLEEKKAVLNVFYTGLVELDPESTQLQKVVFFGKNKDEVRRYLLSLDHVQGVEIKFSPAWMRTVPHVAEHVSVVVKNVE